MLCARNRKEAAVSQLARRSRPYEAPMKNDRWLLNVVAPNFEPDTVGGAGEVMIQLTENFLRLHPNVRIYLNENAATFFPQWRGRVVEIRTGKMRGNATKAAAMLRLGVSGKGLPREGVTWFPFGTMLPFHFNGKGVVTIHDTLDRDFPRCVSFLERNFRRFMIPRTVKRCAVVTSSQFSQERIRRYYGVESTVIPLAPIPLPPAAPAIVPATPYVFYAANAWPHKNHEFLLRMWREDARLREIPLVFTLGSGLGALGPSIALCKAHGVEIHITGRLFRSQLLLYYQSALCSALPSLYEGFGLTAQESLLANCPALVSDRASLTETLPTNYPYVLPLETRVWTETVLALRIAPKQDFSKGARRTTWAEAAGKYLEVLDEVRGA